MWWTLAPTGAFYRQAEVEVTVPVTERRVKGGIRVSTPGGVKAKATTPAKAAAQKRLLNAVEHGFKPSGKPAKRGKKGK